MLSLYSKAHLRKGWSLLPHKFKRSAAKIQQSECEHSTVRLQTSNDQNLVVQTS